MLLSLDDGAAAFLCRVEAEGGAARSAVVSSPDASRDEGWRRSAVEEESFEPEGRVDVRLRFAELDAEEDGEDIVKGGGCRGEWLIRY